MSTGFKTEFRDVIEEPVREMQDTVNLAKSWFDEGRTAVETMDGSNWGTPEAGKSNEVATTDASRPAPVEDAFGAAPAASEDPVSVPDKGQVFSGWGDEEGEDEAEQSGPTPAAPALRGDPTRVDSFLNDELGDAVDGSAGTDAHSNADERSDSFGTVAPRNEDGEPAE
jgi:hypothetical protein